jgi:DNA-binding transcriptional ArsR family regulator
MARTQVRIRRRLPPAGARSAARPGSLCSVRDAAVAYSLLHPIRRLILHSLREPDSAAGLARRLHMPRQVLNYHVKEMARARLLRPAGRRKRRALFEQCYVASAVGYVLAPEILGQLAPVSLAVQDRFSAEALLGIAARMQSEVGYAVERAEAAGKRLATLSLASEIHFSSSEQRAQFSKAIEQAVLSAIQRFTSPVHGGNSEDETVARPYCLVLGCYPIPVGAGVRAAVDDEIIATSPKTFGKKSTR